MIFPFFNVKQIEAMLTQGPIYKPIAVNQNAKNFVKSKKKKIL